jgi:L-arabinokinase
VFCFRLTSIRDDLSPIPVPEAPLRSRRRDDTAAFCERVSRHAFFEPTGPISVARAPGRFDVLGGIADYSGSLVLGLSTAAAALVAAQVTTDGRATAVSGSRRVSLSIDELVAAPVETLARRLSGAEGWAAYVLGPIALLLREAGTARPAGIRVLVSSSVPEGKGLGSSAAVAVATLRAVSAALGRNEPIERLVLLAQQAEHVVAGAPCGVMDQMTAARGEAGSLLAILCRPARIVASLRLPAPLAVWGIDSGVTHAVSGEGYRRVRCAAFMGKKLLGVEGHLAAAEPSQVDARRLPEHMTGREFLALQGGVDDPFSVIAPDASYPVRDATLHPIEEHLRVRLFAELVAKPVTDESARLLGELMYQSNASYGRCGIGTTRTEAIVSAVRKAGWRHGLAGARVSGGGGGGSVVVLGRLDAEPVVARIAEKLGAGYVGGSSAGAARSRVRAVLPA